MADEENQNQIDYKPYFFLKNKTWFLTSLALFAVGLVLMKLLISIQMGKNYVGWGAIFAVLTALVFVISSLGGYATAANMVFFVFVLESIKLGRFAFYAYVVFLPACVATLPVRRGWYHSVRTAWRALVWLPLAFAAGFIPFSIYIGFSLSLHFMLWVILYALGPSLFMTAAGCLYFRFVPVRVRKLFKSYFYENELKYHVLQLQSENSLSSEQRPVIPLVIKIVLICFLSILIASLGSSLLVERAMPAEFLSEAANEDGAWAHYLIETFIVRFLFLATLLANVIYLLYGLLTVPLTILTKAFRESSHSISKAKNRSDIHPLELPIESHDEIGVLYDALRRSERHVMAYLESVEREINLQNDLKVANAASEAKSTFLSNMSHEIRSPINAVLGLDEMIIRETGEPQIKSYATDIQSSGKMLLSLINDILDFSKIEAGKMEIIPVDYDMSTVISDLVNMIAERANKKGLSFVVDVDKTMPHLLHGDDTRLKQCILNILTNAVKYTPSGGFTLTIGYEKLKEGEVSPSLQPASRSSATPSPRGAAPKTPETILLKVSVKDTGIGIKPEDIKKLFSPFERIEEGRNRAIEGTGLGMSIVKNLLAAMNTQLDVQSEYGKGSDFSFRVVQEVRSWEPIGNYAETKERLLASTAAYTESFQSPSAKILVVDDTPINLTVMKGLLKDTRIQIDTADGGEDALQMAKSQKYDVIFIDHMMPKMDGLQTVSKLRVDSTSANQRAVCIALTANTMDGVREFYQNAGFDDYLSKPIEPRTLEDQLAHWLPAEKVLHKGDAGFVEKANAPASENGTGANAPSGAAGGDDTAATSPDGATALFRSLFGIDISAALKNCGSQDVFMQAASDFYDAIDGKSNLIEEYAKNSDWKNYTVLVHALKSSARLIGAAELSEQAKELEAAGDAVQKEAAEPDGAASATAASVTALTQKTPALLADYRAYKARFAPLLGKPLGADGDTSMVEPSETTPANTARENPALTQKQFDDALSALREVVSVFDFDSADAIISQLDGRALPTDLAERFSKIKAAVRNADAARVLELLG